MVVMSHKELKKKLLLVDNCVMTDISFIMTQYNGVPTAKNGKVRDQVEAIRKDQKNRQAETGWGKSEEFTR